MFEQLIVFVLAGALGAFGSTSCTSPRASDPKMAAGQEKAPAPQPVKEGCGTGRASPAPAPVDQPPPAKGEPVLVEFFVMSKCPFGAQVEEMIIPVLDRMGDAVDFRMEFIGSERDGQLTALHGETEVHGDKIQLCASRVYPKGYLKLVSCMNKNQRTIPEGWEKCAHQVGLTPDPIRICADGDEGAVLLRGSYMRSKERKAMGSPTMVFNGKVYQGPRSEMAFTREICRAVTGKRPAVCDEIPPEVRVPILILTDSRCKECDAARYRAMMERMFPGAEFEVVDYVDKGGKQLYASLEGSEKVLLPAILLGRQVEKADNYQRVRRSLTPRGDWLLLRSGGRFDPTREICDNQIDDTGDGKIDCKDDDCKHALVCRPEEPKKLEVFVMSQCPYAVRGLNAMEQILKDFEGDFRFELHYIAEEQGDGFRALHGQPEVEENIRQLCAIKYYGKNNKFMDYIWCRNQDIRSTDWRACTGQNGIDGERIAACANDEEGRRLLRQDIPIAVGLEIRGSPTWLVNGRHKFNGIDEKVIRENFCKHNPEFWGCKK